MGQEEKEAQEYVKHVQEVRAKDAELTERENEIKRERGQIPPEPEQVEAEEPKEK